MSEVLGEDRASALMGTADQQTDLIINVIITILRLLRFRYRLFTHDR